MNKIKVVVSYFGETEQLEFLTEGAFEAFESGWELGALFTDENGGYERVPSDVIRGKENKDSNQELKLFVWANLITGHSAFALARTVEQARAVIERDSDARINIADYFGIHEKSPEIITGPKGFLQW